jgi:uncharacterized protein YciI
MDDVWTAVDAFLTAHNKLVAEQLDMFCDPIDMRLMRYGNPSTKSMQEVGEYGIAQGQKGRGGSEIGFPIRRYMNALAWTSQYMKMTTAKDFAGEVTAMATADKRVIARELQRALYLSTNYTYYDHMYDNAALPIRRLVNGDSNALPVGPNGDIFTASSHTHYLARVSTFAQSDLSGALDHVTEHFNDGEAIIILNSAQEAAVRAFADFVPYEYIGVTPDVTTDRALGTTINAFQTYNRKIGVFRGADVWVKPWSIANYILVLVTNTGQEKVLGLRTPSAYSNGNLGAALPSILNGKASTPGLGDLVVVSENDDYPLYAKQYERVFGFGVRNRVAAAVLYVGGTSYTDPTIS